MEVIHIVDDDKSVQTALGRVLKAAGYEVRTYDTAGDLLVQQPGNLTGCVLLDIRMPGPNGLELQQALISRGESLPIIFLTGYGDIPTSVRAMKAGAVDFLTKPARRETLLAAIRTALHRNRESRAAQVELARFRARFDSLTTREKEVFDGVVAGKLNKQIAADLGAAERTVKSHRAHLMEKMEAGSIADLVHISMVLRANGGFRTNGNTAGTNWS
jgi:FixJ family two-component response regulator